MAYASRTEVPTAKTRMEIEQLLVKHGAKNFVFMHGDERALVIFELHDRRIKFALPLLRLDTRLKPTRSEQFLRSRWRALLLCIKAKLEAVESRIETFEEAFLAHVVMPDGHTVYEHTQPTISQVYANGEMQPLLPPPRGA